MCIIQIFILNKNFKTFYFPLIFENLIFIQNIKLKKKQKKARDAKRGEEDVQGEGEAARKEVLQQAEDAEMGVEAGQGQGEEVEEGF